MSSLLNAEEIGREAWESFRQERLGTDRKAKFYDTLRRVSVKSFPSHKQVKVTTKDKEVTLKADKDLFSMMTLISQNRTLDMQSVLSHPLGPIPWSLATCDGA